MIKRLILGLFISMLFLYFAFRDVSWGDFLQYILGIQYQWLIPAGISVILSFIVRAIRWKMLVAPIQKVKFDNTFSATMIGYMGNNILPFRLGDLLRAFAFAKDTGIRKSTTLASLLLERILDLMTTLMALGLVLVYFLTTGGLHNFFAYFCGSFFVMRKFLTVQSTTGRNRSQ